MIISKSEKKWLITTTNTTTAGRVDPRTYSFHIRVKKIVSKKRKRRKLSKMLFKAIHKHEIEKDKYYDFEKEIKKLVTPWINYEYLCDFGGAEERCSGQAQASI